MSRVFRLEKQDICAVWTPSPTSLSVKKGLSSEDILRNALAEAASLKEESKEKAVLILHDAKTRAKELEESARSLGYSQGYEQGMSKALEQAQNLVEQAREIVELSKRQCESYIEESEPKLLAIALDVARKIVGESFLYDDANVFSMLRQGLSSLGDPPDISIRLNPELVALVEAGKEKLQGQYKKRDIEIIGDGSISCGAIVKTPCGEVDLTLDAQINNLARVIGETRNSLKGRKTHDRA